MISELANTLLKSAILALVRPILTVSGTALVAKGHDQAAEKERVFLAHC